MLLTAAKLIGAGLATIALAGAGVGIGSVFGAFQVALARNPGLLPVLFRYAILGFALTEAIALFGLMMAFLILFAFLALEGPEGWRWGSAAAALSRRRCGPKNPSGGRRRSRFFGIAPILFRRRRTPFFPLWHPWNDLTLLRRPATPALFCAALARPPAPPLSPAVPRLLRCCAA